MRRYDKKQNIFEANLRLEMTHDDTFISDYEYITTLFESCDELNIKYDRSMILESTQSKVVLNEVVGMVVGSALASGKIIDLIGTWFRRVWNGILKVAAKKSKTCKDLPKEDKKRCAEEALKNHPRVLGKTWFEKAGEWIHKTLVMGFFKVLTTALATYLAPIVLMDSDLMETLATTLFYASITIVGVHGFTTVMGHGLSHIPEIVELVTSSTKFYELVLLVIAFFILRQHKDKIKGSISHVSHSLGECIEGGVSGMSELMSELKHMNNDDKYKDMVLQCVMDGGDHSDESTDSEQPSEEQQEGV